MDKQEQINKLISDISKLNDSISLISHRMAQIKEDNHPNYYRTVSINHFLVTDEIVIDLRILLTTLKVERETLTRELRVLLGESNPYYMETDNHVGNVVYIFFANHNFTNGMVIDLHCWGYTSNPMEVNDRVKYIKEHLWEEVCAMDPDLEEKLIPKSEDDIQVWVIKASDTIKQPGMNEVNLFTEEDTYIL